MMGASIEFGKISAATMEVPMTNSPENIAKELEDELLKFTTDYENPKITNHENPKITSYEDSNSKSEMALVVNQNQVVSKSEDVEVDVTDPNFGGDRLVEPEYSNAATEYSSSFDGSVSGFGNGATLDDNEAVSSFHVDASSDLAARRSGDICRMRKKKVTSEWKEHIQPIVWRCKWIELRMKMLRSLAQKIDRELAASEQQKQLQYGDISLEGDGVKSHPFSGSNARNKVFRRKRRRSEVKDIAAYMARHNLFSIYENKKSIADGTSTDGQFWNPAIETFDMDDEFRGLDGELSPWVNPEDGGDFLENIFYKIEHVQSRVKKLKDRVDKVMSENAGKFDTLSLLSPSSNDAVMAGFPRTPVFSPNNGEKMPVGSYIASQLISQYNNTGGDTNTFVPQSAAGSLKDVPDVIESTNQPNFAGAFINAEDDVLIDNVRVKEEMTNFEEVKFQHVESSVSVPLVMAEDMPTDDQPPAKIRSISKLTAKNTRKRGRKKSSGWWR